MIDTILLDLDDTLLGNELNAFMKHYFGLLGEYAEQIMPSQQFIQELLIATRAMMTDTDTAVSNRDRFWQTFAKRTQQTNVDELEQFFEIFYRDHFPQLQATTQMRPAAARLVARCQDMGMKVVVATNPVFPPAAIRHRLAWAGVPDTDVPFALVTTYENMHSTKPHVSYYEEILQKVDSCPQQALMVGNDWEDDIVPAARLGLATYWIAEDDAPLPDTAVSPDGQGTLDQLDALIVSGWLQELRA